MSENKDENLHDVWTTLILLLQISLTIISLLGFGLYLWYLKSSGDQSQSRLLNILNGYLSLTCIGFSLVLITIQLDQDILVDIGGVHIIAISTIFVLISGATILNHFKPDLYLDISVSWRNKVAIPSLIFAFILAEQTLYFSCPENFCKIFRVRTLVMIPATLTSFLCQLLVIIDDILGWRNIYRHIRRTLCIPSLVSPANNGDIEIQDIQISTIPISSQQQPYAPAQGLDQHLVSLYCFVVKHLIIKINNCKEFVSLTTGFLGFCLFNLSVFLISFIWTLLEDFNLNTPTIAWQVAMAVTPCIWITRNKKFMEKIKNLFCRF